METPDLNKLGLNGYYVYLSTYPNNLFLCRIFVFIATHLQGFELYKVLLLVNRIIVNLTGIVLLRIFSNYKIKRKNKILGLIIYELLIGMSPWTLVPYSDTLGIIFPALVLLNYSKEKKRWFNYIFIGLFSMIGYLIKPTIIIILIAITIIELIKAINKIIKKEVSKEFFKKILIAIMLVFLGLLIGKIIEVSMEKKYPYEINRNHSMTIYHYLMMGLNDETSGGFNLDDFWDTFDHYGVEEKKQFNIETWKERLKNVTLDFISRKIAYSYNDGTFAWEGEGEFYNSDFEYDDERLFEAFSNYYKKDGSAYFTFSSIHQLIWIILLLTCLIGILFTNMDNKKTVLLLTIIGQTLFLLLFEARARYLIVYMPIFITTAIISLESIKNIEKLEKEGKNEV